MKQYLNFSSLLKIATVLMTIKVFCDYSNVIIISQGIEVMIIIAYLLFTVCNIVNNRYKYKEIIWILVLSLLIIYTSLNIKNYALIITFLFVLAVRNKNIDDFIFLIERTYILMIIFHFVGMVLKFYFGNMQIVTVMRGVSRWNFGFSHPNICSAVFLSIIMMRLWLRSNSFKLKDYIMLFVFAMVVFLFTKGKTGFILSILSILFVILNKYNIKIYRMFINTLTKWLFPVLTILIYILSVLFRQGNKISAIINSYTTGRIKLAAYSLERSGLTIFGQEIDYIGNIGYQSEWGMSAFTYDNLYSLMFCNIGIIYVILFSTLIYKVAKLNDIKINVFLIVWMLAGVSEVIGLNGFSLFPVFLVSKVLGISNANRR